MALLFVASVSGTQRRSYLELMHVVAASAADAATQLSLIYCFHYVTKLSFLAGNLEALCWCLPCFPFSDTPSTLEGMVLIVR